MNCYVNFLLLVFDPVTESRSLRVDFMQMNYHPDKSNRMRAAIKYYLDGDEDALKGFPGGSEPGS